MMSLKANITAALFSRDMVAYHDYYGSWEATHAAESFPAFGRRLHWGELSPRGGLPLDPGPISTRSCRLPSAWA